MRYRSVLVVVALPMVVSLAPLWGQPKSKDVLQGQCRALLEQVKREGTDAAKAACLVEAETKAQTIVETMDPRYVPAWWVLVKVAWYFGEQDLVAARAEKVKEFGMPGRAEVSETAFLMKTPNKTPLRRSEKRVEPVVSPYDDSFQQAIKVEKSGQLEAARAMYFAAHCLSPAGAHETEIGTALSRLTMPVAQEHLRAGNHAEAARLARDYLKYYPKDSEASQEAVFIAAVAARNLREPSNMRHWAEFYRDNWPQGPHAQEIGKILGEVSTSYYDAALSDVITSLRAGTPEAVTRARQLIEEAGKVAVPGSDGGETEYMWGLYYSMAPEANYEKAREHFLQYLDRALNGRYRQEAYRELSWLDAPLLVFTATKAGVTDLNELMLWTVRSDGSNPRPLFNEQMGHIRTEDGRPMVAISPDAKLLAYFTQTSEGLHLIVRDRAGDSPQTIWTTTDTEPGTVTDLEWAPGMLGVLKFHGRKDGGDFFIWTWRESEPKAQSLSESKASLSDSELLMSKWSPDGVYLGWLSVERQLWLHQPAQGTRDSQTVDIGRVPREFNHKVVDFVWTLPTISGSRPVIIGCTPTSAFKIDMQGTNQLPFSPSWSLLGFLRNGVKGTWQIIPKGSILGIGASSDGDSVAFLVGPSSASAGDLQIYRINSDPTPTSGPIVPRPMIYVDTIENVNDFEFSPLGARLAFRKEGTGEGVYISRFDAFRANDQQVEGSDADTEFFWSPDDGQLLTASSSNLIVTYDRRALYKASRPGNDTSAEEWWNPAWSPDGHMLALNKTDANGNHLVTVQRDAVVTNRRWANLCPSGCQPGTIALVGWLHSTAR